MLKKIQDLKLVAFLLDEGKENLSLDLAMWYCDENACELAETGKCITENGIYFGTIDGREPKFCPVHFFSSETGYKLEPIA